MSILQEDAPLATIARWIIRFTVLGAAFGVWLMFEKTPPIAESGGKPDDVLWYWFWIPIMGISGAIAGMGFGILAWFWSRMREWAGLG